MKRLFDVALALLLLIPAVCICALFAIAAVLETGTNPLFVQSRVGRGRRPFKMLKLRTMLVGTPDAPTHLVLPDRVTATGRLMRRFKVDELPQIWNVLAGSMSFVGPRPCLPCQSEVIAEREARGIFAVKPGITGPAQVAGIDMSTPRALACADAICVEPWRLGSDLTILEATLLPARRRTVPAE
jgi:O-antigen biosynthesis protein WbqP